MLKRVWVLGGFLVGFFFVVFFKLRLLVLSLSSGLCYSLCSSQDFPPSLLMKGNLLPVELSSIACNQRELLRLESGGGGCIKGRNQAVTRCVMRYLM